jgi:hypothetical protein
VAVDEQADSEYSASGNTAARSKQRRKKETLTLSNYSQFRAPDTATMTLLSSHLEQITLSSNAIADLPSVPLVPFMLCRLTQASRFPPPRIFTTALLGSHDITALIRDTEAHERALFQVDPSSKAHGHKRAARRGTMFPAEPENESMASRIYSARNNRNQSAVAKVLGHDMMEEIKRSAGTSTRGPRGEVNIEVLLRGAEILCNV